MPSIISLGVPISILMTAIANAHSWFSPFTSQWAASGRELFFRVGRKMMAVPLAFDFTSVRIGRAQTIFEGDYPEWSGANYDVTADGKQFVIVRTANAGTRTLSARLNWTTELARLAPIQP